MRLRHTLAAAAGALLITVSVPSSAYAADGEFDYTGGLGRARSLLHPPSGDCINVPGATDLLPAHAPKNFTDATATVFVDFDCDGDVYYVMNPGKVLGNQLKFRSVIFS
ncbi:hypothetical protein [Kitasatospora sp. NPDC094015]|uniref:hypothetical protein n=1 Tax=Kitasatospora sp. NPDC094015 TaxID=3155205 RepID=UPI00331722F9